MLIVRFQYEFSLLLYLLNILYIFNILLKKKEEIKMNIFKNIIEKIYLSMDGNLIYFDELTHCYSRYYYDNVCKPKYLDKQYDFL